jgi:hypothetical protein
MNKHKFLTGLLTVLCAATVFSSCKKEKIVVNTDGGNLYQPYIPLEIGKYITYAVDSFYWDETLCLKITRSSQHQHLVTDTFRDNQGRLSYVINVLERKNDSALYRSGDVFYITPAAEQMEYVEKNIRFMRLINPVKNGQTWLGNRLLPADDQDFAWLKGWNYTYKNVLEPYDNGKMKFDNTITVQETDQVLNNPETQPNDYAYLLQSKTVYAYRVGMIYREYAYWIYDPVPFVKSCRKGVGVTMRAIEHN